MKSPKSPKFTFAILLACLLAPSSVWADPYGDAIIDHRYGDYDKAFPIFKKLAEQGDAKAQFYLGHMYQTGEGTKRSQKKSKHWITTAAENGDNNARTALGIMYQNGVGVKKSDEKAFELFKLASENNHPVGRYYLATKYHWGDGVQQDEQMAYNLYSQVTRMSAFSEHLWDMDRWVPIKAAQRMADSGAKETLTTEQAAALKAEEDRQLKYAAEFKARQAASAALEAARLKDAINAAGPLENGLYAFQARNYAAAFPIIKAHAENGDALAQTYAGVMYRDGIGTEQDDRLAAEWFLKAGENGSGPAYYHYADMAYDARIELTTKWTNYQAEGWKAMEKAAALDYQPAKDFIRAYYVRKEATAAESERLRQIRLKKEAEQEAARAEHRRLYGRKPVDYGRYRCRNPRKMLVSRNNGIAREETVCD